MKKYRTEPRMHDEKILVLCQCDLCKKEFRNDDWEASCYEVKDTTISYRTGKSYPDISYGEEYSIDICPGCFMEKLIPWIESEGGEVEEKDWEY